MKTFDPMGAPLADREYEIGVHPCYVSGARDPMLVEIEGVVDGEIRTLVFDVHRLLGALPSIEKVCRAQLARGQAAGDVLREVPIVPQRADEPKAGGGEGGNVAAPGIDFRLEAVRNGLAARGVLADEPKAGGGEGVVSDGSGDADSFGPSGWRVSRNGFYLDVSDRVALVLRVRLAGFTLPGEPASTDEGEFRRVLGAWIDLSDPFAYGILRIPGGYRVSALYGEIARLCEVLARLAPREPVPVEGSAS